MHKRSFRKALMAAAFLMPMLPAATFAAQPGPQAELFPPWQYGRNNEATNRGLEFTVPQVDDLADFHGDITDPKLVLYVGGNYFFAMAPLVAEFEKEHPDYTGRIYWETVPPGLLVKQIEKGGTITSGNMTWTAKPDAYLAGLTKVDALIGQGLLTDQAVAYATNTLTIMVPKGNPAHVTGLADLGKPDVRLAMPNPEFEGIKADRGVAEEGWRPGARRRGLQDQGGRRQHHPHPYPPSSDTIVSDARTCRRRCHMAIRSDVPGAGGKPDHPCRHPSKPEHNGHIRRRGGEGGATH